MKKWRRTAYGWQAALAVIVTLLLCLGAAGAVLAAETEITVSTAEELVRALNEGNMDKVKLGANITLSNARDIQVTRTVTLDLSGHTVTDDGSFKSPHDYLVAVKRGGNLTVTDSGAGLTGAILSQNESVACGIKMTVKGETADGEEAKLTVSGGTIQGYYYGISGNGTRHGTSVTVSGGHIIGYNENDSTGIYQPQDGKLTISGGTVEGASGVEVRAGTLQITGGVISGKGTPYKVTPNRSGTTTVGAGVAIAPHTTKKEINATLSGGTVSGEKTISLADPQNSGLGTVKFAVDPSFAHSSLTALPEGYVWLRAADGQYVPHQHQFGDKKWRWLRIDGEWEVSSIRTCQDPACAHTVILPASVAGNDGSEGTKTYTATDSENATASKTTSSYPVSFSGQSKSFEWGMIASFLTDGLSTWKAGDTTVADGTKSYAFAVTEVTGLTAVNTPATEQSAVISSSLERSGNGKATFRARWSLPKDAVVVSAIIYRGTTESNTSIPAADLIQKGTPYDTGLTTVTGDFTLELDGLKVGSCQHAVIEIRYNKNGVKSLISGTEVAGQKVADRDVIQGS